MLVPCSALANTTTDNVTTQSGDAFGKTVGTERSGLYSAEDVRGFNPVDAGNARIEGLYFDQVDRLPGRLVPSNSVRVGLSAQRFPFPAPTGLVDYDIVRAAARPEGHAAFELAQYGSPGGRLQFSLPLAGEKLSLFAGYGTRWMQRHEGGETHVSNIGLVLAAKPYAGAEVLLFSGRSFNRSDEARPIVFQSNDFLPANIPRRKFIGQPWAKRNSEIPLHGFIAKLPFGDWRFEAGLFETARIQKDFFADIMRDVDPSGRVASRTIIAEKGNRDRSRSGEMRLTRSFETGVLRHGLTAGLRGRERDRRFGGGQVFQLGPSTVIAEDFRPAPVLINGPKSFDRVRQLTYGLAYNLFWSGGANFDASLSKTRYRKAIDFADPSLADPRDRDAPQLWNVAGSVAVNRWLTLTGGAARGMEEALPAPENAINRDVAPPAIRTRQTELGARIGLAKNLALVGGVFSITKPYYNLDPGRRYRALGNVRNRGVELSLTGQLAPGLTVVAGNVLLDSEISGEAVDSGLIGTRPIDHVRRRTVINLDWRPNAGTSPVSFDLAMFSSSKRSINAANTFFSPPRTAINLGARYRFTLGKTRFLLRPQVLNLFNTYRWFVTGSGGLLYDWKRNFNVELLADF